jgi:hypothetical protein
MDARARQILTRVAETYKNLDTLAVRTNFYSEIVPVEPNPTDKQVVNDPTGEKPNGSRNTMPRTLQLYFARPNRFRIELNEESAETGKPVAYQWVCDGKDFFTTIPDRNLYTREKAPSRFVEFSKVDRMNLSSWDVLLLMGISPFENLEEMMDTVQYIGTEVIRKQTVDAIRLHWASPQREVEYRFYIGKEDGLLKRVIQEELPLTGPAEPGKVGDALDELADLPQTVPDTPLNTLPPDEREVSLQPTADRKAPKAFKTRIIFDYIPIKLTVTDPDPFQFTPPKDAWVMGNTKPKRLKSRDYKALREAILKRYGVTPQQPTNPR